MYNLYSGLIGVLIAIMLVFNGVLASNIGNYSSTVIIHIIGLIGISFVLIINKAKFDYYKDIPLHLYSAGAIGVFTVLFNNISFNHLGVSLTLALALLGQSFASVVIDHYGLLGMEVVKFKRDKILGLILISLGIVIMSLY